MTDSLLAALIAAVVSLLVSLLTHSATRNRIQSEERRQEQELRRRLTERLLDLRLEAYPLAFAITDKLRGDIVLSGREAVTQEYINEVLEELLDWQKDHAGFLFTRASLKQYRELRAALSVDPDSDGLYSRKLRDQMFKCKNRFRGALKADLTLLYNEDAAEED